MKNFIFVFKYKIIFVWENVENWENWDIGLFIKIYLVILKWLSVVKGFLKRIDEYFLIKLKF